MIASEATVTKKKSFPYPNDPDGACFEITLLAPVQDRKINSKARKIVQTEAGGEMVFDTATAGSMRAFDALTGWDSVYATKEDKAAGKCMPFTAVNKRRMLDGVRGLEDWILEKYMELSLEREAEEEAERKNLAA